LPVLPTLQLDVLPRVLLGLLCILLLLACLVGRTVCRLRGFILLQQRAGIAERAEPTLQVPTREIKGKSREKE
jgi:hypothetical protein